MTSVLGTLALGVLAGAGFAIGISVLLAAAWPLLRPQLAHRSPAVRANVALGLAAAPGLLSLQLLLLCFVPGLLGLLGLHVDHCVHHPAHPHLCLVHPTAVLTMPLAAVLAVAAVAATAGAARFALHTRSTNRTLAQLRLGVSSEFAPGIHRVDTDQAFSLAAGLGRGEIFVSSALEENLPPAQLAAVIEHERAHTRRRDGLRRTIAQAFSWPHGPGLRRELLGELGLATEQACDEAAGQQLGDRLLVAEAILAVERLQIAAVSQSSTTFHSFGGSSVPARVRALLAEPVGEGDRRGGWWLLVLLLSASFCADQIHHATEHGIGVLLSGP